MARDLQLTAVRGAASKRDVTALAAHEAAGGAAHGAAAVDAGAADAEAEDGGDETIFLGTSFIAPWEFFYGT